MLARPPFGCGNVFRGRHAVGEDCRADRRALHRAPITASEAADVTLEETER